MNKLLINVKRGLGKKELMVVLSLCGAFSAQAAVTAFSTDFSTAGGNADDIHLFSSVGVNAVSISHTTSDRDGTGGDGEQADGGFYFNTTTSGQAVAMSFQGTMDQGEQYTLAMSSFNPVSSYNGYRMQLYNASDDTVLVELTGLWQNGGAVGCRLDEISYTAMATDVGDTLQFRVLENTGHGARDFAIDQISLTTVPVPEPSSSICILLGGISVLFRRKR